MENKCFLVLLFLLTNFVFEKILTEGTDDVISSRCFLARLLREGNVGSFLQDINLKYNNHL